VGFCALATSGLSLFWAHFNSHLAVSSGSAREAALRTFASPRFVLQILSFVLLQSMGDAVCLQLWAAEARGEEVSTPQAVLRALPRLGPLILLRVIRAGGEIIGLVACVVPGLFLFTSWSLAPAAVMTGMGPLAALGRSHAITVRHRLPLFLAICVFYGVAAFVGLTRAVGLAEAPTVVRLAVGMLTPFFGAVLEALFLIAYLRLSGERLPQRS